MILLTHLLLGALIGKNIDNIYIAIILSIISHYFLDIFPHNEYSIENINNNQWHKSTLDFLKVFTDFMIGILIIFMLVDYNFKIYLCSVVAIIPDGLSLFYKILPVKILKKHSYFHEDKIHFLKHKKISNIWRLATQIIIITILILLF